MARRNPNELEIFIPEKPDGVLSDDSLGAMDTTLETEAGAGKTGKQLPSGGVLVANFMKRKNQDPSSQKNHNRTKRNKKNTRSPQTTGTKEPPLTVAKVLETNIQEEDGNNLANSNEWHIAGRKKNVIPVDQAKRSTDMPMVEPLNDQAVSPQTSPEEVNIGPNVQQQEAGSEAAGLAAQVGYLIIVEPDQASAREFIGNTTQTHRFLKRSTFGQADIVDVRRNL
jgi:hypothetical protein